MTIGTKHFRVIGSLCTFAQITPTELEKIVGFTPSEYEAWDTSGFLPWGRSEPQPVTGPIAVETLIRHRLSQFGVLPSVICKACGESIADVYFLMLAKSNGACEVSGLPEDVEQFVERFSKTAELASALTGVAANRVPRFLVRNDKTVEFWQQQTLEDEENLEVINLVDLAKQFFNSICRPIICVDLKYMKISDRDRTRSLTISPNIEF